MHIFGKIVRSLLLASLAALAAIVIWHVFLLGIWPLPIHQKVFVAHEAQTAKTIGTVEDVETLQRLTRELGLTNDLPAIDFDRQMWVYAPYDIKRVTFLASNSSLIIVPKRDQPRNTLCFVRVRKTEVMWMKVASG